MFFKRWALMIAVAANNSYIIIGPNSFLSTTPVVDFQNKANATTLNQWHCLFVHWDVTAGSNGSSSSVIL